MVVACVGGFTSLFAASIAITQFDIKRVLAFSTLSQLGYMVMALGVGGLGVTAGAFHLFTHAFFKALLFLGSGSVIHAVHSNDIRKMGGLRKKMPVTGVTFFVGCLAIAGIFPFAGFFSKDMILDALREANLTCLYWIAVGVAFMTAFYMFRLYFLTFEGPEPEHGHPHESPWTMTTPLVVLAVLSALAGFAGLSFGGPGHSFGDYIHFERNAGLSQDWKDATQLAQQNPAAVGDFRQATQVWAAGEAQLSALRAQSPAAKPAADAAPSEAARPESRAFRFDPGVAVPATLVALTAILLAFGVYRLKWFDPAKVATALGPVYTTVYNKYYIDEFYRWALDHIYYAVSGAIAWFDRHVVDGLMNGFAWFMQLAGGALRRLQTGRVQAYALGMLGGVLILLLSLKVLVP
jgi:NADH-quinone oxidoreductase subunit L